MQFSFFDKKIYEFSQDLRLFLGLELISWATLLYVISMDLALWLTFRIWCAKSMMLVLFPLSLLMLFHQYKKRDFSLNSHTVFALYFIHLLIFLSVTYFKMGDIDRALGGPSGVLRRQDYWLAEFDLALLGRPVATWFYQGLDFVVSQASQYLLFFWGFKLDPAKILIGVYDFFMFAYMSFFLWPYLILAGLFHEKKHMKGQVIFPIFFSLFTFYAINFVLYLFIPVEGPQFFLKSVYQELLPRGIFGEYCHQIITSQQTTFIDCFPSGHAGQTMLLMWWAQHHKLLIRKFFNIIGPFIIIATMTNRYHYTLDVVSSALLVAFSILLTHFLLATLTSKTIREHLWNR